MTCGKQGDVQHERKKRPFRFLLPERGHAMAEARRPMSSPAGWLSVRELGFEPRLCVDWR